MNWGDVRSAVGDGLLCCWAYVGVSAWGLGRGWQLMTEASVWHAATALVVWSFGWFAWWLFVEIGLEA